MSKKLTYEYVKKCFEDNGCELLETEYVNNSTKMKYECICGNINHITYNHLKRYGNQCKVCSGLIKKNIIDVRERFLNEGYELLDDLYVNNRKKLKYKCPNNHIGYISYSSFNAGHRCKRCFDKQTAIRMKGIIQPHLQKERHWNWNPNLTEEDRLTALYGRGRIEGYRAWVDQVFKRDKYQCIICSSKNKPNPHHLNGYHWAKDQRTDPNNGVTLCEKCHKAFHKHYGNHNNTREQFEEWMRERELKEA